MDIDKEDGEYSIQVDLEGGSGKASVTSPTILTVKDGQAYAQIQWSSSNYDYMIVDGEKYLPTNEEGMNSVFEIPVLSMDEGMPVIADTTAIRLESFLFISLLHFFLFKHCQILSIETMITQQILHCKHYTILV